MSDNFHCVVSDNPLIDFPLGSSITFCTLGGIEAQATRQPDSVKNWEYFQGALLNLFFKYKEEIEVVGTAFMVSPGLAMTATHNIFDKVEEISRGEAIPCCYGLRDAKAELWRISSIIYSPDDDIALLSLEANTQIVEDQIFYKFGITTRTPKNGEEIFICGFRGTGEITEVDVASLQSDMYIAAGTVVAVYPHGRDKVLLPYPVIEVSCGSLGGMSGGIAIDKNGLVIGIVSRALDTEDCCGPTYVSWIILSLTKSIPSLWPPGLITVPTPLLTMDPRLVYIDKREALSGSTENELNYKIWFE